MKPQVSVIIPSYNHAHYLPQALHSVLEQNFPYWEVIVIDDGSTDNTADVVSEIKDPRIHYIYQENRGLAGARNTGIRAANSQLVALLDADDLWDPNFLAQMVAWINRHPEAAGIYCGYQYIDEQGKPVGMPSLYIVPPEKFRQVVFTEGNWLSACAVLLRKSFVESIGLFDESLCALEDLDLWLRLSERYPIVGFPGVLVKYRRHATNMTNNPERMVNAHQRLADKLYGPPEGDVSSWPVDKKRFFINFYRAAIEHFLAAGKIEKSIEYLEKLMQVSSTEIYKMGFWRSAARLHLPPELRNETGVLDWSQAERDIQTLLDALEARPRTSFTQNDIRKMRGNAYVALSREAVEAHQRQWVIHWLRNAVKCYPWVFFSRPFYGNLTRLMGNSLRIS